MSWKYQYDLVNATPRPKHWIEVRFEDFAIASGQGVTIIPDNAELTTVQAADVLNVSRPYLIKLLDERAIPHRKIGKHRRIRVEDVMAYKVAIDREREAILDQLTREAQEQGLGYERP